VQRVFLFALSAWCICGAAFAQNPSPDSQTLQALLVEVRGLREELRASLVKIQSSQILLSRMEMQQAAVTRASDHLEEARSKLSEIQNHERDDTAEIKRLEDAVSNEENAQQQKFLQDHINHIKSELEASQTTEQQRQATEIQADQQLRTEQDKLTTIEAQLDELVRSMTNSAERPNHSQP
jgi:DNA repair exonuclease SbcCD ATPase subunit